MAQEHGTRGAGVVIQPAKIKLPENVSSVPESPESQNLTMRMQMRRFTRLTNAFSKKIENHGYAIALHYMHYNFCRVHQTLRVTPAMEADISDHVWSIEEIIGLLDAVKAQDAA
jgi:cell fate regulator YaaT (PSP1 superfamily)